MTAPVSAQMQLRPRPEPNAAPADVARTGGSERQPAAGREKSRMDDVALRRMYQTSRFVLVTGCRPVCNCGL